MTRLEFLFVAGYCEQHLKRICSSIYVYFLPCARWPTCGYGVSKGRLSFSVRWNRVSGWSVRRRIGDSEIRKYIDLFLRRLLRFSNLHSLYCPPSKIKAIRRSTSERGAYRHLWFLPFLCSTASISADRLQNLQPVTSASIIRMNRATALLPHGPKLILPWIRRTYIRSPRFQTFTVCPITIIILRLFRAIEIVFLQTLTLNFHLTRFHQCPTVGAAVGVT